METISARTLGDEYGYLDQTFGPAGYRLAGRRVEYKDNRAYDVLDVVADNQLYTLRFDSTAFRPPPASRAHTTTVGIPGGWLIPAAVLVLIVGYQWASERSES